MKQGIHPNYVECTVRCTCGNTWVTRSTKSEMTVDLCDKCHPFYTGQQKLVDTGGRVQRFANKFGGAAAAQLKAAEAAKAAKLVIDGTVTVSGDVTAGGVSLDNHTHTDSMGGGTSGPS